MQWDECKSFLRVDELLETRTMNTEKLRELERKWLKEIRKVIAVGVACAEQHGINERYTTREPGRQL